MMVSAGATPTTPRDSQSRPWAEGLPAIRKLSSCQVWLCLALHDINLEFKVLKRRYSLQLAAPPFRCSNGSSAVSLWIFTVKKDSTKKKKKIESLPEVLFRSSLPFKSKALIIIFYWIVQKICELFKWYRMIRKCLTMLFQYRDKYAIFYFIC